MSPSARAFRADCHAVARALRGRVVEREQVLPGAITSFVAEVIELPDGPVSVLLNANHPWIGFCEPLQPGHTRLRFIDPRGAAESFASLERYRVLSAAELDEPVSAPMLAALPEAERREARYWARLENPSRLRVGDVIFNFWD